MSIELNFKLYFLHERPSNRVYMRETARVFMCSLVHLKNVNNFLSNFLKKKYIYMIYNSEMSNFCFMDSTLGQDSLSMNYCRNVAWHGDDQPVALLRLYYWRPGCFESGLQLICIVGSVFLTFLLTVAHRVQASGELSGQSRTVILPSGTQLVKVLAL